MVTLQGRRAARTPAVTARLQTQLWGHPGGIGGSPAAQAGPAGSSLVPTPGSGAVLAQKAQLNTEGLKFGTKTATGSGGARSRFYSGEKKKNTLFAGNCSERNEIWGFSVNCWVWECLKGFLETTVQRMEMLSICTSTPTSFLSVPQPKRDLLGFDSEQPVLAPATSF